MTIDVIEIGRSYKEIIRLILLILPVISILNLVQYQINYSTSLTRGDT